VKPVVKENKTESSPKVTLAAGDIIEVKFFYNPELNDSQTIRPDGKITLQLVGDVIAQGKTPTVLRDELRKHYTPELRNPEVAVIVRSLFGRRVYVGGEVKNAGLIQMPGNMTALEAIMQAGGFDPRTAKTSNVVIIRNKDGKIYGCALDLTETLRGNESQPFYLEPQDIVYVPRTTIAKVNQWIDQYITKMIPRTGLAILYPTTWGAVSVDTSATVFVP
jgi:protein involved in polysaccharide export with SLBB domain